MTGETRREEIASLRDALKPFGAAAGTLDDLADNHHVLLRPRHYSVERTAVPVEDFRRAREALSKADAILKALVVSEDEGVAPSLRGAGEDGGPRCAPGEVG